MKKITPEQATTLKEQFVSISNQATELQKDIFLMRSVDLLGTPLDSTIGLLEAELRTVKRACEMGINEAEAFQ